jgi:hypothetical protein
MKPRCVIPGFTVQFLLSIYKSCLNYGPSIYYILVSIILLRTTEEKDD